MTRRGDVEARRQVEIARAYLSHVVESGNYSPNLLRSAATSLLRCCWLIEGAPLPDLEPIETVDE